MFADDEYYTPSPEADPVDQYIDEYDAIAQYASKTKGDKTLGKFIVSWSSTNKIRPLKLGHIKIRVE